MEKPFFIPTPEVPVALDEHTSYVWDIPQKQFCYVKSDHLFLCGYAVEEALREGWGFYSKIVYPEDLPLWVNIRKVVWRYLKDSEGKQDEIDYFSCTFRMQRTYSSLAASLPQKVYHRMDPIWEDDELRYLIGSVESSTIPKAGNLCMYSKSGLTYEAYNFSTKRWEEKNRKPLTERERAILMLAGQGKTTRDIANCLHKGYSTIHNQKERLFSKLNVHSMREAIEYARCHRLMHSKQEQQEIERQPTEAPHKRTRVLLTEEMFQRIQQHLDNGKSMREAAKQEGITERAIRYWIAKGRLKNDDLRATKIQKSATNVGFVN
jgi:DNA-binding NarL/FixJ family response regulator